MRLTRTSLFLSTTFAFLLAAAAFAVPQQPPPGGSVGEPPSPPKRIVYIAGEVNRPGGHVLRPGEIVTILKALALSNGLTEAADKRSARIIKRRDDGSVFEVPVDLGRVFHGKAPDLKLNGGDVLFIPKSARARNRSPLYAPPLPFPGSSGTSANGV